MSARASPRARQAKRMSVPPWRLHKGDEADPEPRMLPVSQGACPFDEFGDIAVLSGEHLEPGRATPAAHALLKQTEADPVAIRSFIVLEAQELAAGCDCTKPFQAWNTERPADTPTC